MLRGGGYGLSFFGLECVRNLGVSLIARLECAPALSLIANLLIKIFLAWFYFDLCSRLKRESQFGWLNVATKHRKRNCCSNGWEVVC